MELILVRHTAILNPEKLCYGRLEIPLDNDFLAAAGSIQEKLNEVKFDAVYSSPSVRCMKLAAFFKQPVIQEKRLMELDFGSWEGLPWDRIDQSSLNTWMNDFVNVRVPGGESYLDLQSRAMELVGDLKQLAGNRYLLVSHGGPVRAILSTIMQISLKDSFQLEVPYGAIFKLKINPGSADMVEFP